MCVIRSFVRWVVRWTVRSAIVVGIGTLVARLLQRQQDAPAEAGRSTASGPSSSSRGADTPATTEEGEARPAEQQPTEPTSEEPDATAAWLPPTDGACPTSHPVKLKESSGIFHLPGDLAYDRTVPDRCYRDAAAAEADGFRQAKR
jgi:hypothetical protein